MFKKIVKTSSGFTLMETIVSIVLTVTVILGLMASAVFTLRFNTLEKSKTLAQDIARNIMAQQVRTVKYETLNTMLGSDPNKSIVLFSKQDNINKLTTSSLGSDLSKLNNATCELNLKKLSDTQLDVKVKVYWDLLAGDAVCSNDAACSAGQLCISGRCRVLSGKTRSFELATIVSNGDLNLKRSPVIALPIDATPKPSSCSPACGLGFICINGSCISNNNIGCGTCAAGLTCDTGDGVCKNLVACTSDSQCSSGNCISGYCRYSCPTTPCLSGQTCDTALGQCFNNISCSVNSDCFQNPAQVCSLGRCVNSCTTNSQCSSGSSCQSGICKPIPTTPTCTPVCNPGYTCLGLNPERPDIGTCVNNCELPSNRPRNCTCATDSQCSSGICRATNNTKCD